MDLTTLMLLIVSTISIILIGYVVLVPVLRALERPALLLPWKRTSRVRELEAIAEELQRQPMSDDDRLALQRAINTLSIPSARQLSGPWSKSDPIVDAERDILMVHEKYGSKQINAQPGA